MAETVFAVIVLVALGVNGYVMWLMRKELRKLYSDTTSIRETLVPIQSSVSLTREVLTEASRLKSLKTETNGNGANIAPVGRYVPIARRRAMAEAESLAPVTHDAKVRDNNARAMESV